MNTKSGIKLTPVGKRFADVVKRELADPDSTISQAVRNLKGWKHQVKQHPREFQFALEGYYPKSVVVRCGTRKDKDSVPICSIEDMSIWYKAFPDLE